MDKRYQVFVSSTYEDLKKERQEVIKALLNFDCIPVGMEFFPAADDSQWEVIRRVIEESDYYLVIVAGRYGSLSAEGISYTEKEYKYAIENQIPVMAFLHGDPGKIASEKTEASEENRKQLQDFRDLCQNKLCDYWKSPEELAGKVLISLNQLKRTKPAIGWVKADQVPDESAPREILNLKKQVELLTAELEENKLEPPKEIENLAQEDDEFTMRFDCHFLLDAIGGNFNKEERITIAMKWNRIFAALSPYLMSKVSAEIIRERLQDFVKTDQEQSIAAQLKAKRIDRLVLINDDLNSIILQLHALGLILKTVDESYGTEIIMWKLTLYGEDKMMKIRALKRN